MYEICTLLSSFGQKMYGPKVLNIGPFRCTTYVEPDQIIFERFWTNLNLWRSLATEPIIFTYDEKARHLVHQDSRSQYPLKQHKGITGLWPNYHYGNGVLPLQWENWIILVTRIFCITYTIMKNIIWVNQLIYIYNH